MNIILGPAADKIRDPAVHKRGFAGDVQFRPLNMGGKMFVGEMANREFLAQNGNGLIGGKMQGGFLFGPLGVYPILVGFYKR